MRREIALHFFAGLEILALWQWSAEFREAPSFAHFGSFPATGLLCGAPYQAVHGLSHLAVQSG
jgi:hypothetical protein